MTKRAGSHVGSEAGRARYAAWKRRRAEGTLRRMSPKRASKEPAPTVVMADESTPNDIHAINAPIISTTRLERRNDREVSHLINEREAIINANQRDEQLLRDVRATRQLYARYGRPHPWTDCS